MNREKFGSRLGFILLSAGCAIGIGNVWRFPYVVGQYGGGAFVLAYIFFLIMLGVPILTMEFAVGRASQKSIVHAFKELEPKGTKWHLTSSVAMIGNYVLLMFYTVVSGWMLYYFYSFATGELNGLTTSEVATHFNELLLDPFTLTVWMGIVVAIGFGVCTLGLQKGVEKITKIMMLLLISIMCILAINSLFLEGGEEGLAFYLLPDLEVIAEVGLMKVLVAAMNQAFFTLSLGMGSMLVFGSFLTKERSLFQESLSIAILDTMVAIISGLIIFPACFAYGVAVDSGPSLIFVTLPNVFINMPLGQLWGSLFFLFMSFASLSTIIAVSENVITMNIEKFNISRKKACIFNGIALFVLSLPCVFGFNIWSHITPFGEGTNILDLEDYIVSNVVLPVGSLVILLFCTTRFGWGYKNFLEEANTGSGLKMPRIFEFLLKYIIPILLIILVIQGIFRL